MKRDSIAHRRTNDALSIVIVLVAVYIFVLPILPALLWWLRFDAPVISNSPVSSVAAASVPQSEGNSLYIPSLAVAETILEGESVATVDKGVWHRPKTSTPDKGSNTVLAGHRFAYGPRKPFYNLDKIEVGHEIAVTWNDKVYTYTVTKVLVVPPSEISIEAPTDKPILTLYTCTPLWSSKSRLVVQASLKEPVQ